MGLTKVSGSKPYVTDIPEETHLAICVGLYDVGTQYNKAFDKHQKKLYMVFEFPEIVNHEGFPKVLNQDYTQSLDPKSKLYAHVTSWRGKSFKKEELKAFNIREFALGKAAMLQVVHKPGTGDRADNLYANINNLTPVHRSIQVPEPTHALTCFDFDDGVAEVPEGTPDRIAQMIVESPEWKDLKAGKKPGANGQAASRGGGKQAPAEIVDALNEFGIGWPFDQEELEAKSSDMSPNVYEILVKHASPF